MARFFIVSGESSGDKLGALLGNGLLSSGHEVRGWGGSNMEAVGIILDQDIETLQVMGWSDVLLKLPKYAGLLSKAKKDILQYNPDKLILIDFGSFNLRLAKWANRHNIKVVYYSPPKVWASRSGRVHQLKKYCDTIIVLFPFEKQFYEEHGIPVHYFGHPFANIIRNHLIDQTFKENNHLGQRPVLSIIPGSRRSEISYNLPIFLDAVRNLIEYQICISVSEGQVDQIKAIILECNIDVSLIEGDFYNLLAHSDLALITSGTATFEAALFRVPHIIGYKTSLLNYLVAKALIKTKYIGLPNLIAGHLIVPELIQEGLNGKNIEKNIIRICQPDAKLMLVKSFNGIINAIYKENCLSNTLAAISSGKS